MPTTRANQVQTPVNADTFNLTGDLAKMADSAQVIVTVANQAAGDAIATARAAAGFAVSDARPLFCWDLSTSSLIIKVTAGWKGGQRPFGHMGKTNGFQSITVLPTKQAVFFAAAQVLEGGMTYNDTGDAMVVPKTGPYNIRIKGFWTGGPSAICQAGIRVNNATPDGMMQAPQMSINKQDGSDVYAHSVGRVSLNAGDEVGLWEMTSGSGINVWGTNGYDGAWLEVEWAGAI
jgi:hypothetical protein